MNSFTIFEEYIDLITLLPSEEDQKDLLWKIAEFMFYDKKPTLNERQTKIFKNLKRPLEISKKNSNNAKRNKRNKNEKETKKKRNENETKTKQKPSTRFDTKSMSMSMSNKSMSKEIIDYLNTKSDSNYKSTTTKTQVLINARLNEGYKLEDFKTVIDKKCDEWIGTEWEKFLRPETLFSNKFESYLNQKQTSKNLPKWFNEDLGRGGFEDDDKYSF